MILPGCQQSVHYPYYKYTPDSSIAHRQREFTRLAFDLDKFTFKMEREIVLIMYMIFIVLMVASGENNPTTSSFYAEATPVPGIKCQWDTRCAANEFCRPNGACVPCVNCSRQHRFPANNECAKGSSECGGCLMGYKLVGDHCTDEVDDVNLGKQANNYQEIFDAKTSNQEEDSKAKYVSWTLGICTVLGAVVICCGVRYIYSCSKQKYAARRRRLSGSGESGQTDGHDMIVSNNMTQAPTAPLLEEYSQPPAYSTVMVKVQQSPMNQFVTPSTLDLMDEQTFHIPYSPRVVNAFTVTATPFNAGNGAGDWANEVMMNLNQAIAVVEAEPQQNVDIVEVPLPIHNGVEHDLPEHGIPGDEELPADEAVGLENVVERNAVEDVQDAPPGSDENQDVNMQEAGVEFVGGEEVFFEFGLEYRIGLRARSASASSFHIDDTMMDLSPLFTNPNSSHASSTMSVAQSFTDSGTGTSNEDYDNPQSPRNHQVPSMSDGPSAALADNEYNYLYGDENRYELIVVNENNMEEEE